MPLRDYKCRACEHELESLDKLNTKRRTCPACHQQTLEVVFNRLAEYHARYSPMHPRRGRGRTKV